MNVISGRNVDLIFPFPQGEVKRTYGWNHCYRTHTETDDSPQTQEEFVEFTEGLVSSIPSWGIVDKNHITNIKHEAPLVGIVLFDPIVSPGTQIIRSGQLHVATARKAWRTGLVDEAGFLILEELFREVPSLLRVGAVIMEKNFPAKGLVKRLGFKFEGIIEDAISKDGKPENLVMFGLTRRNYNLWETTSWDRSVERSGEWQEASSGHPDKAEAKAEVPTPMELNLEAPVEPAVV